MLGKDKDTISGGTFSYSFMHIIFIKEKSWKWMVVVFST